MLFIVNPVPNFYIEDRRIYGPLLGRDLESRSADHLAVLAAVVFREDAPQGVAIRHKNVTLVVGLECAGQGVLDGDHDAGDRSVQPGSGNRHDLPVSLVAVGRPLDPHFERTVALFQLDDPEGLAELVGETLESEGVHGVAARLVEIFVPLVEGCDLHDTVHEAACALLLVVVEKEPDELGVLAQADHRLDFVRDNLRLVEVSLLRAHRADAPFDANGVRELHGTVGAPGAHAVQDQLVVAHFGGRETVQVLVDLLLEGFGVGVGIGIGINNRFHIRCLHLVYAARCSISVLLTNQIFQ